MSHLTSAYPKHIQITNQNTAPMKYQRLLDACCKRCLFRTGGPPGDTAISEVTGSAQTSSSSSIHQFQQPSLTRDDTFIWDTAVIQFDNILAVFGADREHRNIYIERSEAEQANNIDTQQDSFLSQIFHTIKKKKSVKFLCIRNHSGMGDFALLGMSGFVNVQTLELGFTVNLTAKNIQFRLQGLRYLTEISVIVTSENADNEKWRAIENFTRRVCTTNNTLQTRLEFRHVNSSSKGKLRRVQRGVTITL
jgi:hypothetical protein